MDKRHTDHESVKRVSWAKKNVPVDQPLTTKHYRIQHLTKDGKRTLCGLEVDRCTRTVLEDVTDSVMPSECRSCNRRTRPKLTCAMKREILRSYDHDGGDGWLSIKIKSKTMEDLQAAGLAEYLGQWPRLNWHGVSERTKLKIEAGEEVNDGELEYLWGEE